jgi:hypothetical protein
MEWWMIGLTAAVALFTCGLVVVDVLQWRTYQASLDTTNLGDFRLIAIQVRDVPETWR